MEFTNETLTKMQDNKLNYNKKYSRWYYGMSEEYKDNYSVYSKKLKKRSDKIDNCMNLWLWDVYHKNKVMNLQKVNRCMNNRFCPNCRKLDLARAIHNFKPIFFDLGLKGYKPYMITLSVPNVPNNELNDTLNKMNKSFAKFFNLLSKDTGNGQKGFSQRLIQFDGALKVLEMTTRKNKQKKVIDYHPHYHIIMFSEEYEENLFKKNIQGRYSTKRKKIDKHSLMDIHIMQLWTMCYKNIRMSKKNYNNMSDDLKDLYMCDIRELNPKGIYEVMKYTFKDTDIDSYGTFKTFATVLENRKIRQGYGLLRGIKLEDDSDGDKQSVEEFLSVDKKETPEQILTREFDLLISGFYHNYKKISTCKCTDELKNIE